MADHFGRFVDRVGDSSGGVRVYPIAADRVSMGSAFYALAGCRHQQNASALQTIRLLYLYLWIICLTPCPKGIVFFWMACPPPVYLAPLRIIGEVCARGEVQTFRPAVFRGIRSLLQFADISLKCFYRS